MSALEGKSIVVTRALHQADEFNALLRSHGAVPLSYPCIAITPPENTSPIDHALNEAAAGAYDWLILTSSNAAFMLAERLHTLELPPLQRLKVAAVGEATAQAAQTYLGLQADVIPNSQNADAIGERMASVLSGNERLLLPQSDIALSTLSEQFAKIGVSITTVTAYQTVIGSGGEDVPTLVRNRQIDAITFTSPSTVDNFLVRFTHENGQLEHLTSVPIACIGTVTARAAEEHGLCVSVVPPKQSISALTKALEVHFAVERL
jgi:uroporphyrinogen-III synthase